MRKLTSLIASGLLLSLPTTTPAFEMHSTCVTLGTIAREIAEDRDDGQSLKVCLDNFNKAFDRLAGGKSKETKDDLKAKGIADSVIKAVLHLPYLYTDDEAMNIALTCEAELRKDSPVSSHPKDKTVEE